MCCLTLLVEITLKTSVIKIGHLPLIKTRYNIVKRTNII